MIREMLKEPFILGTGEYPGWFMALDKSQMEFNVKEDTGELISLTLYLTENKVTARAGDILGLVNNMPVVIPAEAAKIYM